MTGTVTREDVFEAKQEMQWRADHFAQLGRITVDDYARKLYATKAERLTHVAALLAALPSAEACAAAAIELESWANFGNEAADDAGAVGDSEVSAETRAQAEQYAAVAAFLRMVAAQSC